MSLKTLPLLFINLGGEMIYILDQRLKAQEIPADKAKKVMHDICGTMLNKRFMEELFKPQEMYSKKAMRTVFDRLAHASIMRLNPASMDKLYDLMTMAFKYQVSLSLRPKDILLVTLNHMDAIRKFTEGSKSLTQQVENVFNLMIRTYESILPGEFMLIRQTLLNFFQDNHIKVSIFLKDGVQGNNGRFILPTEPYLPAGTEMPGTIKMFDANEKEKQTIKFNPGQKFQKLKDEGSFKLTGSRNTHLGANMYSVARSSDTTAPVAEAPTTAEPEAAQAVAMGKAATSKEVRPAANTVPKPSQASIEEETDMTTAMDSKAVEHLDMLSKLLTGPAKKPATGSDHDFRLNLFNTDEEEEAAAFLRTPARHETMLVNIDATKRGENKALSRISGQMSVEETQQEDNLLDLMDESRG